MATINPFAFIRRRLKLTQAEVPGLSATTVQRIENGQYEELSDGMIGSLVEAVEYRGVDFADISSELSDTYGTPYLTEAYATWRGENRKRFGSRTMWPPLERLTEEGKSPMSVFIRETAGTEYKFCTGLSIQEPTVGRYVRGEHEYFEAPWALDEALAQAGYADRKKLFALQREWIEHGR